ncbi:hypothetical protein ATY02_06250 [Pseudomonas sp. BIOMIG1BAC]|uniref:hypothetical protein n=1 Tax=Pseudomonas sp. BIOMIG1N TaxID=1763882 RepID=UPI00114CB03B|nr:hypothetical protein [Pseudomonas sp. BIOMIG1N]QIH06321.1 hypothetical protein ATY02_06250 [Pseudomonas sp. BIOMIG1BAC]
MNGLRRHSSGPLILFSEISLNIEKDGTARNLIALRVSPFSYGELKQWDIFVPLPDKKSGATTEKNHSCRVKEKSWNYMKFLWRH